jgi:hypothetical protein
MTKKVVLKEYCAEIENLKAMLQITREKNGVYVDPFQFANMESRLLSQESQLLECESALKIRTDEIKLLKIEKEDLVESLSNIKSELVVVTSEMDQIKDTLSITESELASTTVELVATTAVVDEQIETESDLTEHVTDLQRDLTGRREDIGKLFDKVDLFVINESSRISSVKEFVSVLNSTQQYASQETLAVKERTSKDAIELCDGVTKMLSKGNDICSQLKVSIAQALQVLVGDTCIAKDKMNESCVSLDKQLSSSQQDVIKTLETLQDSLSNWLGDVEINMNTAKTELMSQQQHVSQII